MAQPPNLVFADFVLLGSIGNHQRIGIWINVKKVKITAPYCTVKNTDIWNLTHVNAFRYIFNNKDQCCGSGTFLPPGSGIGFFRIPDPTITSESLKHFFLF